MGLDLGSRVSHPFYGPCPLDATVAGEDVCNDVARQLDVGQSNFVGSPVDGLDDGLSLSQQESLRWTLPAPGGHGTGWSERSIMCDAAHCGFGGLPVSSGGTVHAEANVSACTTLETSADSPGDDDECKYKSAAATAPVPAG